MNRPLASLRGTSVSAVDGALGSLADILFHDALWVVHGVVVHAHGRVQRVLVPAASLHGCRVDASGIRLGVALADLHLQSFAAAPAARSARSLVGYSVERADGPAGRIDDVVVDDAGWWIPELVVHARSLLPGAPRLVPSSAVAAIDSIQRKVMVLPNARVRNGPHVFSRCPARCGPGRQG
jgi:hypothetical protein